MKRFLWLLLGIIAASASLAGCGSNDGTGETAATNGGEAATSDPIIIGTVTARSGGFAFIDEPSLNVFKKKIDEVNAAGGIKGRKLEVISGDMESTPQKGTQVAQELIDRGADALVVSCDYDFGAPAANVGQRAGKLTFSTCAASPKFGVQGIGNLAFSAASTDASEGAVGAAFALKQNWKDAFFLVDTTISFNKGWAAGFRQGWTEGGGKIVGRALFKNPDTSIATQVTQIKAANPGFVVLASYQPGGVTAIRQIRAAGIDVPIIAEDGMDGTRWNKAAPGVKEVYVTTPVSMYGDDPNPKVNEIFAWYREEYDELPGGSYVAVAYAAAEALVEGMTRAENPTDGAQVAKALESEPLDLVVGKTTFSAETHISLDRAQAVVLHAEPEPVYKATLPPATEVTIATSAGPF
jgi:branched-chain amino acid transport system substrate-binding protein